MDDAQAGMPVAKVRWKKVRTGCITCKIRRIKCDETKPNCLRCSNTGRKCDGYQPAQVNQANRLNHNISIFLPGTKQERRAFEFFRTHTIVDLCGYFPEEFWERNILQASFDHPALRHAIVALGSLHESFVRGVAKPDSGNPRPDFFAVAQHTKAISKLYAYLSDGSQDTMVTLMSCILFVCFDSLMGDFDSAITHLKCGIKILKFNPSPQTEEFRSILSQIGIQASFFVETRDELPLFLWELTDPIPGDEIDEFESIEQANCVLISIIDSLMHFLYVMPEPPPLEHTTPTPAMYELHSHEEFSLYNQDYDQCWESWGDAGQYETVLLPHVECLEGRDVNASNSPAPKMPSQDDERQVRFARNLLRWSTTFDDFLRQGNLKLNSRDLRAAMLLKIHYTVTLTMIQATLAPMESERHDFSDRFETIIKLCSSVAKAETPTHRSLFTYRMGIIGPLYYAAINTRDRQLRLLALDILSTPRREGMWDSRIAAFIISRIMELEEAGVVMAAGNDMGSKAIPERVDVVVFNRTPRDTVDHVQIEIHGAIDDKWTTFGKVIEWPAPTRAQVPGVWKGRIHYSAGHRPVTDLRSAGGVDI